VQITELVHPLQAPERARLSEFFNAAYGKSFGEYADFKCSTYWQWLYKPGATSLLLEKEGRVAGHAGCVPFVARQAGRRVPGTWGVDTYVLSEHRRQGYGTRLQMAAHASRPLFSSFWLSDANSRIKLSMGQEIAATVTVLRRPNDAPCRQSSAAVGPPDPPAIAAAADDYLRGWDFYVERSPEYCAWRFVDQPRAEYVQVTCAAGVALVRRCGPWLEGQGAIGDAFPADRSHEAFAELIEVASGELLKRGCGIVRFACSDPELCDLLGRRSWTTSEVMSLHAPKGSISGRVFLSLSDQDVDQFPC
jgi:Acetyltransferase (GNAT) family